MQMKTFEYQTQGTCSRKIIFALDGDIIKKAEFVGGCPGNTVGLAKMIEGRKASEVADMLAGIKCGAKPTSCPDQLAKALRVAIEEG